MQNNFPPMSEHAMALHGWRRCVPNLSYPVVWPTPPFPEFRKMACEDGGFDPLLKMLDHSTSFLRGGRFDPSLTIFNQWNYFMRVGNLIPCWPSSVSEMVKPWGIRSLFWRKSCFQYCWCFQVSLKRLSRKASKFELQSRTKFLKGCFMMVGNHRILMCSTFCVFLTLSEGRLYALPGKRENEKQPVDVWLFYACFQQTNFYHCPFGLCCRYCNEMTNHVQ